MAEKKCFDQLSGVRSTQKLVEKHNKHKWAWRNEVQQSYLLKTIEQNLAILKPAGLSGIQMITEL